MTQNTDIKQPIFADYSKSTYHASDSLAGLVVGLFIIGSLIGRFGTGKICK